MATIIFLGVLAEKVGRKSVEVEVKKSVELKEIYLLPFREEDILILIDGKVGHLTSLVEDRCSITIMPMLSGG
jgi:molybdopterin converting factor small subunit